MAARRLRLLPSEQVLVDIRPHWTSLTAPLLTTLVVVAVGVTLDVTLPHSSTTVHWIEGAVVGVPCLWLAVRLVRWRRAGVVLTTYRLVDRRGGATEFALADIEEVVAVQGVARRLLGTGSLDVVPWGEEVGHRVPDVRHPDVLARIVTRRLTPPDAEPERWG